jgi:hypothetical protein
METVWKETGQHAHAAVKNSERKKRNPLNAKLNGPPRKLLQRMTNRVTNRLPAGSRETRQRPAADYIGGVSPSLP